MTVLDQAFIKAYTQREAEAAASVPMPPADSIKPCGPRSVGPAAKKPVDTAPPPAKAAQETRPSARRPRRPRAGKPAGGLTAASAAKSAPASAKASKAAESKTVSPVLRDTAAPKLASLVATPPAETKPAGRVASLQAMLDNVQNARPVATALSRPRRVETPAAELEPAPPLAAPAEACPPPPEASSLPLHGAEVCLTGEAEKPVPLRPALQVDSYAWPTACQQLVRRAAATVDELAEHLQGEARRGRKVIGLVACRSGHGATTMLLAAAQRLAARGLTVAMVDANFAHPALAGSLGLAPENGWQSVLSGELPVAEVAIESVADRIVLVPLVAAAAAAEALAPGEPAALLKRLRDQYDIVLIDLGEFRGETPAGERLRGSAAIAIDAAVIVVDVRRSATAEWQKAAEGLVVAGVPLLGTAENFVAG